MENSRIPITKEASTVRLPAARLFLQSFILPVLLGLLSVCSASSRPVLQVQGQDHRRKQEHCKGQRLLSPVLSR